MIHQCDKPCGNKTASGYCATTVCINPKYSNIGTVQYGQGVQKRIITNADRIRSMTDEELADWLGVYCNGQTTQEVGKPCVSGMGSCEECWLDWLKGEVSE